MRTLTIPFLFILAMFVLLCCATTARATVGFQHFTIPDLSGPKGAPAIEIGVWYPTDAPASLERLELGEQIVANDAPIRGTRLPLIVMSHGHGGSYAGHSDTALALAHAGFIAAALTHPGDNYQDESLATQIWERPRQLKVMTDYLINSWSQRAHIDAARVGAFGFSAGGFTVLVEAGGVPDLTRVRGHCKAHPTFETCRLISNQPIDFNTKIAWTHDRRIRAVVSAAPAIGFTFTREGLRNVRQPIQLWRAGNDQVLPHPYYAEAVRRALPTSPEVHVVPGAGHYDFIPPCSPKLAKAVPQICTSEAGFDRAAFHANFDCQVVAFFKKTLGKPGGSATAAKQPLAIRHRRYRHIDSDSGDADSAKITFSE
jgi:predicted dienelactone hydrolase